MMMAYEEVVVIKMNVKHQLNNLLMTHDDSFVRSSSMDYRKISNTIRTLVQYAPQTFTGEPWENVSLDVLYAPVLCHPIQTC